MENIIRFCKEKSRLLAFLAMLLVTVVIAWITTMRIGYAPVSVIAILIIEILLAALMHGVELWLHAVLVLVEILAGVALGKITLVLLCLVVYLTMTLVQQIPGVRRS